MLSHVELYISVIRITNINVEIFLDPKKTKKIQGLLFSVLAVLTLSIIVLESNTNQNNAKDINLNVT